MTIRAAQVGGLAAGVRRSLVRTRESLCRSLPEGGKLPADAWRARHRGILALLWLHVPGIMVFGWMVDNDPGHVVVEAVPIAAAAAGATYLSDRRTMSTVMTAIGLMTASAVLVHLSGGVIEAHFHFFVMVGVIVLYQEWWPYLVAIAYVILHHGVIGTLFARDVFNHDAAARGPWKWAALHGGFILAMSVAGVLAWRLNETLRATTALRERQMAEAQQLAHIGSWDWDIATGRLDWSDELYRIFGFQPGTKDPRFEWLMERIHPDDRDMVGRALDEAIATGSDFTIDFRFLTPTGDVRWMHGRGQAIAGEDGKTTAMRGTGRDITDEKRMQAALVKEGVLLRGLLQTVAVAANEATTVKGAIQVAIDQICSFTGWPVGHAFLAKHQGQTLTSSGIWHLDDLERFEPFRRTTESIELPPGVGMAGRVVATAAPAWVADLWTDPIFSRQQAARTCGLHSAFAFPLSVGDDVTGVLEFFTTRSEPVDDQLLEVVTQVGKQLGLVVEKTSAIEKLWSSNERHRAIVASASDAFIEMDEQGLITNWNRSSEAMFGWSAEEAIGRELAALVIPEQLRTAHREGLRRYLATGVGAVVSNRVQLEALHRDGDRFPVELAVWEVASDSSRFFNAFVRDMSQQKEAEEALASARDKAVEASRLKSEFLANMSHEIRTPMNGVIGLTGLLLDTTLDDTQRKYAEGVESAGNALLTVINDVLDLSKVEAGKTELEQVDFDLREVIEESAGLVSGPAAAKGIELATWCYPNLPTAVRGDPVRLRQVLLNLVGNAVKFTEQGQVVVQARPLEVDEERVIVRIDVIDTGIGIEAASFDRLFRSFSQADASTTRRYGGTGLGLALVARLVDLMGGEVGVESEPGRGSAFWFTVPLARSAAATAPTLAEPSLSGVRVLVVDDNATNCLILGQQLVGWDVRPEIVQDPRRAVDVLRGAAEDGDPFGVAVVDMQMPHMDGIAVAEAIGAESVLDGLPVVLLSSAGTVTESQRMQSHVSVSLMKPVRQAELHDALTTVLGRAPEATAPGEPMPDPVEGRGHVLVVEDNAINQTVARGMLAKLGYQTDVADNGRTAGEAVSRHDYAAVLMDCQMPEMDGYEATREIRRRERDGRHVPIIAMTASATEADRSRCLAAGMDDYVAKPVRTDKVAVVLERWVGTPDEAASASSAAP